MRTWTLYTRAWNDLSAHCGAHPNPLQSGDSLQHTCRNMRKRKNQNKPCKGTTPSALRHSPGIIFLPSQRYQCLVPKDLHEGESWMSFSFPSLMLRWLSWAFSKPASLMRRGSLWWKHSEAMGKHVSPSWSEPSEVLWTVLILRVLLCILHLAQLLCWWSDYCIFSPLAFSLVLSCWGSLWEHL